MASGQPLEIVQRLMPHSVAPQSSMDTVVSLFYKGHAFLNDVMSEDQEKNTI